VTADEAAGGLGPWGPPAARLPPRGDRPRLKVVESFQGPRLRTRTGAVRRIRSMVALVVIAVAIGTVMAGALGALVWGLSRVIHHAASSA